MPTPAARKSLGLVFWIVAACTAFGPVLFCRFVDWDDREMVVQNPMLLPGHARDVLLSWTRPTLDLYAPLTYSTYAMLAWIGRQLTGELSPPVFHAANLLVHCTGSILLFALLRRLCRDDRAALIGALVWAVHPIQTEAVAWAASLNTCLCITLAIAALLLQTMALMADSRSRRSTLFVLAAVALVLSLCAKPASVGWPLAAFGINRFVLSTSWRKAAVVAAAALLIEIPFIALGAGAQPAGFGFSLSALQRLSVIGHTFAFYLFKIAVPVGFTIDYGLSPDVVLASDWLPWAGTALLPIGGFVIWQFRRRPWLIAAACLFVGGVGPVCGVRNFEFQNISTVADRYVYFAMVGIALGVAMTLRGMLRSRRNIAVATVAMVVLAAQTFATTLKWHDSRTLTAATIGANPQSLAAVILEADRAADTGNVPTEEREIRYFLTRRPMFQPMNKTLAYLLLNTGREKESVQYFERALQVLPEARTYNDLGLALIRTQQYDAALRAINAAITLRPTDATQYANQGEIYLRIGNATAAAEAFRVALKIDPADPSALRGLQRIDQQR